jgi:hypothetical protein
MLGIGLHAYGFMDQAFVWLMAFIGLNIVVIGLACLHSNLWRSLASEKAEKKLTPQPGT